MRLWMVVVYCWCLKSCNMSTLILRLNLASHVGNIMGQLKWQLNWMNLQMLYVFTLLVSIVRSVCQVIFECMFCYQCRKQFFAGNFRYIRVTLMLLVFVIIKEIFAVQQHCVLGRFYLQFASVFKMFWPRSLVFPVNWSVCACLVCLYFVMPCSSHWMFVYVSLKS